MSEQLTDVDKLPNVKLTPEQDARAIAMAQVMTKKYLGNYSAARVIVYLLDEVARLENHIIERQPLNVTCESCIRLRTTLTGIASCSTCEACRGAATLALGTLKAGQCPPMSETPRTANEWKFSVPGEKGQFVRIEFAQALERELNAAYDTIIKGCMSRMTVTHLSNDPLIPYAGCKCSTREGARVPVAVSTAETTGEGAK